MTTNERRQFYRTPCTVLMELRNADKETVADNKPSELFENDETLGLLGNFHQLDKQSSQIAHSLRAGNLGGNQNALLDYLDLINRKINCLSQSLLSQNSALASQTRQQINLSESGLCFQSPRSYYKDATVAVRLVFLPQYLSVILFARVVRCEQHGDNHGKDKQAKSDQFHIALNFLQISEANRQIIAQQVMAAQLSAQRAAKKRST